MALTKDDEVTITRVFEKALETHIPVTVHKAHHDWISIAMERKLRREAMVFRIKEKLITIGIASSAATALAAIWYAMTNGFGK